MRTKATEQFDSYIMFIKCKICIDLAEFNYICANLNVCTHKLSKYFYSEKTLQYLKKIYHGRVAQKQDRFRTTKESDNRFSNVLKQVKYSQLLRETSIKFDMHHFSWF